LHPVFAVDVSPDRSSASIAVAGLRPDGRVGLQVVDHREGTAWIVARAKTLQTRWNAPRWTVDERAAVGSLSGDLGKIVPLETLRARDVAHACGQLFDGFRDDTLRHYAQGSLKAALAAVDKRDLSESWAFDRRNAGVDISPLMAVTFAHWGYLRFGVQQQYDIQESVHFDLDEIKRLVRARVYGPDDIKRLRDEDLISDNDMEALTNAGFSF
jgi:hypothetical protein